METQKHIWLLMHSWQCREANCRLPNCQKMKRVVTHTKVCKRKLSGGCPICKWFTTLCCYHAKHCQETKCLVPLCLNIKDKMRRKELQQRSQQMELFRRKMALIDARVRTGGQPQGNADMSMTVDMSLMNLSSPHQPEISMLPDTQPVSPHRSEITQPLINQRNNFDASIGAKEKDGHAHPMEELGAVPDDGSSPADAQQANPQQEATLLKIQGCIQSLTHSYHCREATCRLPNCQKFKRIVAHTKLCKRKMKGGCPICTQIRLLCCYHAKRCQETTCPLPFCSNIKHRMRQKRVRQQLEQMLQLTGQMARMDTRPLTGDQPQTNAGMSMNADPTNLPPPRQPATQPAPARVLQRQKHALLQFKVSLKKPRTPEERSRMLQILKRNPQLMAAFVKRRMHRSFIRSQK